jgi:glyoxylase-like metal-dependent hydrolase (beta-lactamase superfamily II)
VFPTALIPCEGHLVTSQLSAPKADAKNATNDQLRVSMRIDVCGAGFVATFALVLVGDRAAAQSPNPGLQSNARGLAVIDSAITAHGGASTLRGLDDVSLRFSGRRWMAYQSRTLERPWDTQPTFADIVIDLRNNRLAQRRITRYPLDFAFVSTVVTSPQATFFWDSTRTGAGDAVRRFPGGQAATHPVRRELPAFQLLQVRDRAETVRWLGERTENGRRLQGVSYAEPNGAVYELWIDARTRHLVHLEWLRDDPVDGDQVAVYTYSGYRDEQGIPVPTRLVERRNGDIVRDDTIHVTINARPVDALFQPPAAGFTESSDTRPTGADAEPVRKLAENVWLLQQLPGGNRVMFVTFRDHVLVFEAPTPQAAGSAVIEAVRRTVPDKPIRYVTFSHHHDDHGGGLRPYIANGVTIVTTPTNRAFIEHVARASHTMRPDALSADPRAPIVETFTRKRVFTDGEMTVELHDIGPTSHVDEIVMAYLPNQKLIFQGDLLILPERGEPAPANTLTAEFARAIERLGLDVQTIAGVHGPVGTIQDLRAAVAKRSR